MFKESFYRLCNDGRNRDDFQRTPICRRARNGVCDQNLFDASLREPLASDRKKQSMMRSASLQKFTGRDDSGGMRAALSAGMALHQVM